MAVEKKNPNATTVAATSNVMVAINDRHNRTETAAFGASSFALSGTSDSMTAAELWDGDTITLTGTPSGAFTLTVPAGERGPVRFVNTTAQNVTVTISGQSGAAPVIPAGGEGRLNIDDSNVTIDGMVRLGIARIIEISQATYDALGTPDTETLYVITS